MFKSSISSSPSPQSTAGSSYDWSKIAQGAGYGGQIGGALYSLFGGGGNPYAAASPYLKDIDKIILKYMTPYHTAGMQELPFLQNEYSRLAKDPGAFLKMLTSGYQESPQFQLQRDQALKASNQAAAAGGMLGTPSQQAEIASTVNRLANADMDSYVSKLLGIYGQGLQGKENLYKTGYGASTATAQSLAQARQAQAQLAMAQQMAENQADSGFFGGLGSLIGGVGGLAKMVGWL